MSSPADGGLSVEATAPAEAGEWNAYLVRRPEATYCHRYEWRRIAEDAYGRSCIYLAARHRGEIVGVLPMVWMAERLAGRRLVSMPYLDLGGPVADDESIATALLDAALDRAGDLGARAIELRESAGSRADRPREGRFRFVLELPPDSDQLWGSLGAKVRNQIRKARKSGLSTARVTVDRLPRFYRVFGRNMRDLGSPVHSQRFLREVLTRFGEDARLFLTADEAGNTLAGAIGISFGGTLTVPWASALRSARHLCPNHSLYWSILEGAIAEGVSRFDFGRSSAGTGTFRFKKQWGAEPVPLLWRDVDRAGSHPHPTQVSRSTGARLLVAVWRRLPLALANRLGPLVRGRLPQ